MSIQSPQKNSILLSIDVEDWFHVENFKSVITEDHWGSCELRVENNVHRLLDLFDSIPLNNALLSESGRQDYPKATFFVLGWVAEKCPSLVREIHKRGHEIASHGFQHSKCTHLDRDDLRKDLTESKKLLEDIIGEKVRGYRAPSFSITNDSLKIVRDAGYLYDTSYNSFSLNENYGSIQVADLEKRGIAFKVTDSFYEIPISNYVKWKQIIPWGGGAYFRLIPLPIFIAGVKSILKKNNAYMFYLHPWEIDDMQPRVKKIPFTKKVRHYTNLKKTYIRLEKLIQRNSLSRFLTCTNYLKSLGLN